MHLCKKSVSFEVLNVVEINSIHLFIHTFTYMPGDNLIKFFSECLVEFFYCVVNLSVLVSPPFPAPINWFISLAENL